MGGGGPEAVTAKSKAQGMGMGERGDRSEGEVMENLQPSKKTAVQLA